MSTAKAYALGLLNRRAYTEKALYGKLCEKYGGVEAAEAVARMLELGLLDDLDYARRLSSDLLKLKGYAPRRAKTELMRRGIDADTADEALGEYDMDPKPAIAQIIKRRYIAQMEDEKGRQRAFSSLLRLGYSRGDILTVLRHIAEDENYYDDWEQE